MNISFEKSSQVSAVLTVKMEKADYADQLKKSLKTFCQKAQMPGFRPGKVPMSLVQKMYGPQAKADEVNKLLSSKLLEYIKENKVNMLGEPLPSDRQVPQDIDKQDDFEFVFDIALAPEFEVALTDGDTLDYYDIEVSAEQVEQQVKAFAGRAGHAESAESYEDRDVVRGPLVELDGDGRPKDGGLRVEKASLMPAYFKNEDQKRAFEGARKNDVLTLNLSKAYAGNEAEVASLLKVKKEEVAQHAGDFSFQVEEISRFVPAEINQELFDSVYGKDAVKSEEEFRARIKEGMAAQYVNDSDYKFLLDVRAYVDKKVGELEFPDVLLKRIMKANNADKDESYVEENYGKSIAELKWHLIKEKLVAAYGIKVEDKDVKAAAVEAARFQFAQYGMNQIPDEYLENYAKEMMNKKEQVNGLVERCIDAKLIAAIKPTVKLARRSISVEDFNKMF